jgi:hypothetical protein
MHSRDLHFLALGVILVGFLILVSAALLLWIRHDRAERVPRRWAPLLVIAWGFIEMFVIVTAPTVPIVPRKRNSVSSNVPEPEEIAVILKLTEQKKQATLAKDYEKCVSLLSPDIIKAAGGRTRMITSLKIDEAKNRNAGIKLESIEFSLDENAPRHTCSEFKIILIPSTVIVKLGDGSKLEVMGFHVAFCRRNTSHWYLLDGTNMTDTAVS